MENCPFCGSCTCHQLFDTTKTKITNSNSYDNDLSSTDKNVGSKITKSSYEDSKVDSKHFQKKSPF